MGLFDAIGGLFSSNPTANGPGGNSAATGATNLVDPNSVVGNVNYNTGAADQTRGQQQDFASALRAQMNGGGPNLGGQQFQNALNQSIQSQQAQTLSQKGINPALAMKMAAENGMAQQAQGAGQSAMINMQNQLNAQGQLGNVLDQTRAQDVSQMGTVGSLQNQMALGKGQLESQYNQANVTNALGAQGINAGAAAQNTAFNQGVAGGAISGLASGIKSLFSSGGEVPSPEHHFMHGFTTALKYAMGGSVPAYAGGGVIQPDNSWKAMQSPLANNPWLSSSAAAGYSMFGVSGANPASAAPKDAKGDVDNQVGGDIGGGSGADVPGGVEEAASNPAVDAMLKDGGKIDGKAKVDGDSPQNDTVPAVLSPGEIVIPRSIANSPDAENRAADFVAAIKKHGGKSSYGKVLAAKRKAKGE